MNTTIRTILTAALLAVFISLTCTFDARAQDLAGLTGVVTDAQDASPLPYATVVLTYPDSSEIIAGSTTGDDGRYRIENVVSGRYVVTVSYVGYRTQEFDIELAAPTTRNLDIAMELEATYLDQVVVTASGGQQEKMLDAPASISVIGSDQISREVGSSPVDVLRQVPGVDVARTGIDRREIVVRGFSNTFSGSAYVMTDYRQSAIASLGVNAFNMMPISSLDLDRIEVLRGPAGALYGPGVDDGVIHFISKSPFEFPGTALAITGGQQSIFGGQIRHAGVIGGRLGYKFNGLYQEAEDWKLDPNDPLDADQIRNYHSITARMRDVKKVNVNGMMAYRFSPSTSLTAGAGYGSATSVFLSDIGTLQSRGFGYRYGQLRFRSGRFFAQAYLNKNDTGDSFAYAGPRVASSLSGKNVIDQSTQLNVQAQHGFGFANGREQIIVGVDFERTNPATKGTITGRNEDDDLIEEYGTYAQSRTAISNALSLTLAGRLDYDNIFDKLQVSPRAALVYKPAPGQAFRATYNRSFSSPKTNSLFLDLIARDPDAMLPLTIRARGAAHGFTFAHNPAYGPVAGSDLVAYSLNPDPLVIGRPQPTGLPLDQIYGAVYQGLVAIPSPVLQDILEEKGIILAVPEIDALKQLLSPQAGTNVEGFTRGSLALLNVTTGEFEPVSTVSDIRPIRQSTTRTFELGYKGIIGSKMIVALDGYYTIKNNFVRGLQLETPFVLVPQLVGDLTASLESGIEGNATLAEILQQKGLPPSAVAQLIVQLAEGKLPSSTTPVAVVQPVENNPGPGRPPELMMTYRNFGRVAFYGVDASIQFHMNERTTLFGGFSVISDGFFDHDELGESNPNLFVALNASPLKAGAGVTHAFPGGVSFKLAGRYAEGFTMRSGPYNGRIEDAFLLDAGAGVDLGRYAPGMRLDVTVQNVLNDAHREFIGAPKMGRLGIARLTYTL